MRPPASASKSTPGRRDRDGRRARAPRHVGRRAAEVTEALAANADRYDRSAEFPWEPMHAVHDAGLLTLGIGRD